MVFKEISESNMLDDFVQEIDSEGSFADIAVNVDKGNHTYSNIKKEMGAYEATLEDIENTWPSWKGLAEIDLERARYLLSTDDMLEEVLGKTQG
jgi:hypothetical protein